MRWLSGLNKKSSTLYSKMIIVMVSLVIVQFILMTVVLTATEFYVKVDNQSLTAFSQKANEQGTSVNNKLAAITQNVVYASESISQTYIRAASLNNDNVSSTWLSGSAYSSAMVDSSATLINLLDNLSIDSAFFVLNSANTGNYPAVSISNTSPTRSTQNKEAYELRIGSSDVSKQHQISVATGWDLFYEMNPLVFNGFYENPLWAVKEYPNGNLEQYGYWDIPKGNSSYDGYIYYTVPLIDNYGVAFGVVGIGISSDYFAQDYLSSDNIGFSTAFNAIAMIDNNTLVFDVSTPNSADSLTYLDNRLSVSDANITDLNLYTVKSRIAGDLLFTAQQLSLYSNNSPFINERMDIMTFVQEIEPRNNSADLKKQFTLSFIMSLIFGVVVIVILSIVSTRKISSLAGYVRELSPYQDLEFQATNIKEIDDLTSAIGMLNEKVIESSKTVERIIKLTALNLGGYEVLQNDHVVVTEYIRYLLGIDEDVKVTKSEWDVYFANLTKQPLKDQKDVYGYYSETGNIWLKIINSQTDDGDIGMVMDVTKEIQEAQEAQNKIDYDGFTKLYSRLAFQREATLQLESQRDKHGAMLFIDLDNLKFTNDTFGHESGDTLILSASGMFNQFSKNGGLVARISGDEFAIFIHGYQEKAEVQDILNEKFASFEGATIEVPDGSEQKIRFSTGIAWYPNDGQSISELIKHADFAMYEAKHNSKGSVKEFDRQVYDENVFMMENREAINQLIEQNMVSFMFQPIVDIKTGDVTAYEALMRSKHDAFKSPIEILKVAKAQFKLNKLEKMLITKAIGLAYDIREQLDGRRVYINSITSQSIAEEDYDELKEKYGDFLTSIVIEITEAEDNTPERMNKKVSLLRGCGMQLAIDDFGSGYSNETRITSISPDIVKIDMALVMGISKDEYKRLLVSNIVSFSHSKNIQVIAEGVDNSEDFETILSLDVDYVQGFYTATPSFELQKSIPDSVKEQINKLNEK